jgi:hypothetical protein
MRLAAGMLICLTSGTACAYEQLQGGFTSGGGSLASASHSGFGYLDQQSIGTMNSASYSLSAGFLTGDLFQVSVPGAPTVLRLIPGNGTMRVLFAAPASNGGASISSYRATCTPASGTVMYQDGTASPITVTGLINNQSYSCSVTATNSAGTSVASDSFTKVVRPTSIVPILTILFDD